MTWVGRLAPPVLIAVVVLAGASLAIAQGVGAVRGQVTDEAGGPIAGAMVTLSSTGQGVSGRGTLTDAIGSFQIQSLPPGGDYVLRASFPGRATVDLTGVEVRAGQATVLRVSLPPESALQERVEVRARPQVVVLEETTNEARFSAEFIGGLPILGRNYQDILALAPGVSDIDGDGNPNIHGARDTDVITLVDGVSTTDPLTGKIGAQLNIESIQEIEVKTSGATAEFGRAQGGFANIITKSGGNEFQGTFKFYWQGSWLDGDGAGVDDPRLHGGVGDAGLRSLRFNDFLPFLSLSGPIVRDRAWFFMAHEYIQNEDPVNAVSNAFVTGLREWREFVKLTWQAGSNSRLALSVNYDPQRFTNQGLNSFTREESGHIDQRGGTVVTARATLILGPLQALETTLGIFNERPAVVPTTDPDTNGNEILAFDRNGNGFFEALERDPGEDFDSDGAFDVFEDTKPPRPNRTLDAGEDRDGDRRLTPINGCEGALREDTDCDGWLDWFNEDRNGNGLLDPGEDIDTDNRLDLGTEDRNGNRNMDDTPFPEDVFPYGRLQPVPADREYTFDQRRGIIGGPYLEDLTDRRRRFTFRQDLSTFVPDYWGSHDLKLGFVLERENFDRRTESRALIAPNLRQGREGPSTVRTLLPAEARLENTATGLTTGLYLQDLYKPFPNLSLALGLRFDRETARSFGYSFFEPAAERALYDRLAAIAGFESNLEDFRQGNNDGFVSMGIPSDPLFNGTETSRLGLGEFTDPIRKAAISRLTRHHIETQFLLPSVAFFNPDLVRDGQVDPRRLIDLGVQVQERESFALTNNNLAPRLAVSWDPWSDGRTKLFATWGRYFDKLFLSTVVAEEGPDTINRYYLLDPQGVNFRGEGNHQIGRLLSSAPPSASQIDRGLQTPFSDEISLGFERELAPDLALSITYVNRRYRQQIQDIDINHTLRTFRGDTGPSDLFGSLTTPGFGSNESNPDGRPDLFIQNFFFNQVLRIGNFNEAHYRGLEVELLKRLSRRWELQGSYTYSRAVGAAEDFQSRLGNDPSTVESEFGYLDFDQRHVVKLNAVIFLPRDWQVGWTASWASGLPYSVISRFFAVDNVGYQQFRTRFGHTPIVLGQVPAFVTQRRNDRRNDATYQINLRARKSLVVGGASSAVFVEIYNLLNTDDLRIFTYEPDQPDRINPDGSLSPGPLQIDALREFGRRFQIGFQVEF